MSVASISPSLAVKASNSQDASNISKPQDGVSFAASSISTADASRFVQAPPAVIVRPSAPACFFHTFRLCREKLLQSAKEIRSLIDAHKKFTLLSSKDDSEEAQEKALSKKILAALSLLEQKIQALSSQIDEFAKNNPISAEFLIWTEEAKKELEEINKDLCSVFQLNKTLAKNDLDSDSNPITFDTDQPLPIAWQIKIHDFTLRCSDVIESGLLAESQAALVQMLKDFEMALQAVPAREKEKNKSQVLFLEKQFQQMQESFKSLPQEVEKRQQILKVCKIFSFLGKELKVMAEMAEAKLAKESTIQELSSMLGPLKDKVRNTKDKVCRILKDFPFAEDKLIREELSTLKEKTILLQTLRKEILTKIEELRMASKRKRVEGDSFQSPAKKAKVEKEAPPQKTAFTT